MSLRMLSLWTCTLILLAVHPVFAEELPQKNAMAGSPAAPVVPVIAPASRVAYSVRVPVKGPTLQVAYSVEDGGPSREEEALRLLQSFIKVPGVNPPGNELHAARFLARQIELKGIQAQVIESAPGRGNVLARIKGDGSKRPIVLLCHLDVVPANASEWEVDPFEGIIKDDFIYGRGALDDRGMCVANLYAFLELKRRSAQLSRDVIYLATADEENGSSGVRYMLEHYKNELDAEYVINEGGVGLKGAVVPGQVLFAVSVAEKGFAWIRLTARGHSGHGSTPKPNQALDRLRDGLALLAPMENPPVLHEQAREMLRRIGATQGGLKGFLMRHPALAKGLLLKSLSRSDTNRATISNTMNLTIVKAGDKINVVPGLAEAWLDCRLLPTMSPEAWTERIRRALEPYGIEVTLEKSQPSTTSPWDTELFHALERHLPAFETNAVVAPVMSPGYTDSTAFRLAGATAYGIAPFVVSPEELRAMHGANERLRVEELGRGFRRLYHVLTDVAVTGTAR